MKVGTALRFVEPLHRGGEAQTPGCVIERKRNLKLAIINNTFPSNSAVPNPAASLRGTNEVHHTSPLPAQIHKHQTVENFALKLMESRLCLCSNPTNQSNAKRKTFTIRPSPLFIHHCALLIAHVPFSNTPYRSARRRIGCS